MSDKKEIKMNEDFEKDLEKVSGGVNWNRVGRTLGAGAGAVAKGAGKAAKETGKAAGAIVDKGVEVAQTPIGGTTIGEVVLTEGIRRL